MITTLGLAATLLATVTNVPGDSGTTAATPAVYVLSVGNNSAPAGATELAPLRFADDDALRFFAFADRLSRRGILLASVDKDTRARQPDYASLARDPTSDNLRLAIAELRQQIVADRTRHAESHVFVFFSGHGVRDDDGRASLALADGRLTQEQLYEQVLGNLPATYIHLLVDACHAESFVQPRSAHAATVPLDQADASAFLAKHTLGRFPNVGAIVAGTSRAETHEWDLYQGGVFTHQLLSGLRGAGDVNGDGRVEYSEIFAFLTAANAAVLDPAARLSVSVRAPASKPNIPIVRLTDLRQHGTLILTGSTKPRPTHVEDDRGERLADFNPESRFRVSLALPADRQLFLRDSEGELVFRLGPGQVLTLSQTALRPRVERPRGAIAVTFRRGPVPGPIRIRLLPGTDEPARGPHPDRPVRTADAPSGRREQAFQAARLAVLRRRGRAGRHQRHGRPGVARGPGGIQEHPLPASRRRGLFEAFTVPNDQRRHGNCGRHRGRARLLSLAVRFDRASPGRRPGAGRAGLLEVSSPCRSDRSCCSWC